MSRIQAYLPSYCYSQSKMKDISGIVIHYFSGKYQFSDDPFNIEKCFDLFRDLNRPASEREYFSMSDVQKRMYASAHFLIARNGTVYKLVPLPYKSWHAGTSEWNGKPHCNNWMVGIEMVATHKSGFTDEQYIALSNLTKELINEYNISWDNITGHENVAPGRKNDPGPKFDWVYYKTLVTKEEDNSFFNFGKFW